MTAGDPTRQFAPVTRPLLLLDVDGVLAPLGPGPPGETMTSFEAGWHEVSIAARTPERLARLAVFFRLIWATSWQRTANERLGPALGLPPLPVIPFPTDDGFAPGASWKLAAVERFVKTRPFAWLDDELGVDVHRWAAARTAPSRPLDVRPDHGMTEEHVVTLMAFALELRLPQPAGR